jgi:hypothetical protein
LSLLAELQLWAISRHEPKTASEQRFNKMRNYKSYRQHRPEFDESLAVIAQSVTLPIVSYLE